MLSLVAGFLGLRNRRCGGHDAQRHAGAVAVDAEVQIGQHRHSLVVSQTEVVLGDLRADEVLARAKSAMTGKGGSHTAPLEARALAASTDVLASAARMLNEQNWQPYLEFVPDLLSANFAAMVGLGDKTLRPFLRDVVRFDGLSATETKKQITADLAAKGQGKLAVNFKLRDWLFSRQRYWGEPFPLLWVSREDYAKIPADSEVREFLPKEPVTCQLNGVEVCAVPLTSKPLKRACTAV